jgi:hypothetical protein
MKVESSFREAVLFTDLRRDWKKSAIPLGDVYGAMSRFETKHLVFSAVLLEANHVGLGVNDRTGTLQKSYRQKMWDVLQHHCDAHHAGSSS